MSAYRVLGTSQPYNYSNTPPQAQRQPSYGYNASPSTQQQFGYQSYNAQPQQQQLPPLQQQQQQQGFGMASTSNSMQGLSNSGGPSNWQQQQQQQQQGGMMAQQSTPQSTAPKAFSWGLPIAGHTPKAAADDAHHGSPESPRVAHGTPSHTPNRNSSALYPSFDADDEAPPRESTLGMEEDYGFSPPSAVQAPPRSQTAPPSTSSQQSDSPSFSVIIFGFTPTSLSAVQQAFTSLGDIASTTPPPHHSANWFTLSYRSKWDASLAVRRSGEIVAGCMIGVKWADGSMGDSSSTSMVQRESSQAVQQQQQRQQQPVQNGRPPVGERVAVLSAAEALKRPTSAQSSPSMFGRMAGGSTAAAPGTSIRPMQPTQQPAKQGGISRWVSDLVFGE